MCYDCDEDSDYYWNMISGMTKKDKVMTEDRTKKHWKVEGSNTKFGTIKDAEDEAKKRAGKQNADYNVYEFVSQAQAVVPDVPVVKIV
jgi:hypothetical protein